MRHQKKSSTFGVRETLLKEASQSKNIIYDFSVGQPDFEPPKSLMDKIRRSLNDKDIVKYTEPEGNYATRKVAVQNLNQAFHLNQVLKFIPEETIITNGGREGVYIAFKTFLNPLNNHKVLVIDPAWSYRNILQTMQIDVIFAKTFIENKFKITVQSLEKILKSHLEIQMLVINSPNNPTGYFYSEAELSAIGHVLEKYKQVKILWDDPYGDLAYHKPIPNIISVCPALRKRIIVVRSAAKTHAIAGLRCAYVAASKEMIASMKTTKLAVSGCTSGITQKVCQIIWSPDNQYGMYIRKMAAMYFQRYQLVCDLFSKIPGFSPLTNADAPIYCFVDITQAMHILDIQSDVEFAKMIAKNTGVIVLPGSGFHVFGTKHFIRFALVRDEKTIIKALGKIKCLMNEKQQYKDNVLSIGKSRQSIWNHLQDNNSQVDYGLQPAQLISKL